jgi:hypothetical protein
VIHCFRGHAVSSRSVEGKSGTVPPSQMAAKVPVKTANGPRLADKSDVEARVPIRCHRMQRATLLETQ